MSIPSPSRVNAPTREEFMQQIAADCNVCAWAARLTGRPKSDGAHPSQLARAHTVQTGHTTTVESSFAWEWRR